MTTRNTLNPILLLGVLTLPALAGCLGPSNGESDPIVRPDTSTSECTQIRFPAVGQEISYWTSDLHNDTVVYSNRTVLDETTVRRGDGSELRSMVLLEDGEIRSEPAFSLTDGDLISRRTEMSGFDPSSTKILNEGFTGIGGNHFFGKCVQAKDAWVRPIGTGDQYLTITAERSSTGFVEAVVSVPEQQLSHWHQPLDSDRYVFQWNSSTTVADTIIVDVGTAPSNESTQDKITWHLTRPVEPQLAPIPTEVVPFVNQTTERWDRWPPMASDVPRMLNYSEFVGIVAKDPDFQDYLIQHPDASPVYIEYLHFSEERSRSDQWEALFRGRGEEAFNVMVLRRCFDDELDKQRYGECETSRTDGRTDRVKMGKDNQVWNVEPTTEWVQQETVPLTDIMERNRVFHPGSAPSLVMWYHHPPTEQGWKSYPRSGAAGWRIGHGTIPADVDYGPLSTLMLGWNEYDLQFDFVDRSGWYLKVTELPGEGPSR